MFEQPGQGEERVSVWAKWRVENDTIMSYVQQQRTDEVQILVISENIF